MLDHATSGVVAVGAKIGGVRVCSLPIMTCVYDLMSVLCRCLRRSRVLKIALLVSLRLTVLRTCLCLKILQPGLVSLCLFVSSIKKLMFVHHRRQRIHGIKHYCNWQQWKAIGESLI